MLHLKNQKYIPRNSRDIVHRARELCKGMVASIRVVRVATKFIELDISVDRADFDNIVQRLQPIGKLDNVRHVVEENISKDDGIRDGIFYYNNERFWEAHEAWEGVWKKCKGKEKLLVQGIILLAVSFAHCQKDDDLIGLGMLSRSEEKIGNYEGSYHGIDIDRIKSKIIEMKENRKLVVFKI